MGTGRAWGQGILWWALPLTLRMEAKSRLAAVQLDREKEREGAKGKVGDATGKVAGPSSQDLLRCKREK